MFRNYIKIAFRSLLKNKSYVIINMMGMGIAIACCIIAYLNYDFNAKFDHNQKNLDQIYHVVSVRDYNDAEQPYGIVPLKFSEMLENDVSGIDATVRMIPSYASVKLEENVIETNILFTDASIFDVFTFEITQGSTRDFDGTKQLVISEEAASKYFGEANPIGQTIEHLVNDEPRSYSIAAVFRDLPENSSLEFVEAIASIENYRYVEEDLFERPWNFWTTTFVQIKDPAAVSGVVEQMQSVVPVQNEAREDFKVIRFELATLDGMADRAQNSNAWAMWLTRGVPTAAIIGPMVMAILLMLLACFNYTNTSIAMSGRRLKEIGLRKVMGGIRSQLMIQFIIENLVMCVFSVMIGIVIAELLIPYYNAMWDFVDLKIDYLANKELILFIFGLLIVIGLIAGSYPSYYISRFEATPILRGTIKFGGNTLFSKVLLVLQLSISLIALVAAFAFVNNAKFQDEIDLGFNKDEIIYTFVEDGREYDQLASALEKYDIVEKVSGSEHHILSYVSGLTISMDDKQYNIESYNVGYDYFEMMDIEVLDGRGFAENSETDLAESVVANKEFIRQYNIQDPIGHKLTLNDTTSLYIIGVVEDTYTNALWGPVEPILFRLADKDNYTRIIIRTSADNMLAAHKALGEEFSSLFPFRIYNGIYMNDDMAEDKTVNKNIIAMFVFLGLVAMILSITGLYAMISLNLLRRTKEIGVRKVLGASVQSIVSKLNLPFVIMVAISILLGSLAAYYFVDALLAMIWQYYAPPNISSMVLGSLILLVIALGTVTGKVVKAATVNPVNSLRSE